MAWDDDLPTDTRAYQIAADGSDRLRVIAGPGTGKSFSMRRRVARLIESGVAPNRILAVTFTRIAAEDIRRELNGLDVAGAEEIHARTLHSLAMRILRKQQVMEAIGRVTRPLLKFELRPLLYDLADPKFGNMGERDKRIKAYEAAFARSQDDDPIEAADEIDKEFRQILVNWMHFHECILLGEAIPFLYIYLRDNPASPEFETFDSILVDEYQDLNKVEQSVVSLLAKNANLVIVGDENQSIYSFKHAHPEGIIEWEAANENRSDHQLSECYRCPSLVVSMANSLIANNPNGDAHALAPRPQNGEGAVHIYQFLGIDEEVEGIAQDIVQKIESGTPAGDIIVLTPRKALGLKISNLLREAAIPCRDYLSESELETDEVTEALALLMVAGNTDDRPALRWLLGYGSGDFRAGQYRRLRELCVQNHISPWEALEQCEAGNLSLKQCSTLRARFSEIKERVDAIHEIGTANEVVDNLFPEGDPSYVRIRELLVEEIEEGTSLSDIRKILLEKIYEPNFPDQVEYVRIMTLYGSKGLGSPVVYITSLVDDLLPRFPDEGDTPDEVLRKRQEQRRLFYVALTRVKSIPKDGKVGELTLSSFRQFGYAEAFNLNNGNANALASRFLAELGPDRPAPVKK